MKKSILVIIIAVLSLILLNSFIIYKTDFSDESCGGRCSGTAYCSACSNCSGCKHCIQNGGTCGVCSGGSTIPNKTYSSRKYSNRRSKTNSPKLPVINTEPKASTQYYEENSVIIVTTEKLNVRSGPGLQYSILTELTSGDFITILENNNSEWVKIKINKNNVVGYVYSKYL
jgi:uncharacterized protein YgiM (DUF1202 family)